MVMIKKILLWKIIGLLALGLFSGIFLTANSIFAHNSFMSKIANTQGKVVAPYDGSFIAIEFDKSIIRSKGDTQIIGYLVAPNGFSFQLKTINIPEAKSKELGEGKTILWPTFDIFPLLAGLGYESYALQVYVQNNGKSVELPLIEVSMEVMTEQTGVMV